MYTAMTLLLIALISSNVFGADSNAKSFKNTTEIPEGITTPDVVETSIGELNFFDGVSSKTARS